MAATKKVLIFCLLCIAFDLEACIASPTSNAVRSKIRTVIDDAPYFVEVIVSDRNNQTQFCGGAVIAKNLVLTSRGCLPEKYENPGRITVHNTYYTSVAACVYYPCNNCLDYKSSTRNNVVIIKVKKPIPKDKNTKMIVQLAKDSPDLDAYVQTYAMDRSIPKKELFTQITGKITSCDKNQSDNKLLCVNNFSGEGKSWVASGSPLISYEGELTGIYSGQCTTGKCDLYVNLKAYDVFIQAIMSGKSRECNM